MRLTFFNKEVPENNKWCVLYPKEEYGALTYNHKTENVERWITDQIIDNNFENMMFLISQRTPLMSHKKTSNLHPCHLVLLPA